MNYQSAKANWFPIKFVNHFWKVLFFYNQTGSKAVVFYIETVPVIPTVLLKTIRSIYTTTKNKSTNYILNCANSSHPLKQVGFLVTERIKMVGSLRIELRKSS